MLYCLVPRQFRGHSLFAIYQGCRIRNGTSEWPSSYFLRFRGLKIAKIGHNWRVSKIGTKPYAGYTAVSYLERIRCYREKSPLLAPSGIGSMGTFTTQDILTFLYWLQNRLGFCWTYALAAKVSFPCIRFCWTYAVELPEWIDKGFVGLTTELAAGVNIALFHTKMKEKLAALATRWQCFEDEKWIFYVIHPVWGAILIKQTLANW